jgi:hypothetical protein
MKDFDLAAAKRGATVCTRGGDPVRIFSFDCRKRREGNVACPIVAEVFYKGQWEFKDGNWAISDYEESGRWHGIGTESEYDLMMADDDYLEKLERGEYGKQLRKTVEDLKSGATSNKDKTTENWDYWRMKYAGDIMSRLFGSDKLSGITFDIISREVRQMADALVEELKRTKK